jgi:ABC-2 type transport system permease protein
MMLILSIPMIFMSQSITHPDMPIIKILCWVPPFTPFMMMVRAAAGPTLLEMVGTGLGMVAFMAVTLWLSGKAFRAGALSTSKLDPKALIMGIIRRRLKPV